MEGDRSSIARPWWVKVGLWGISSRGSAWSFVWLSIAIGGVCLVAGIWIPGLYHRVFWLLGGLGFVGAVVYLLAIRWVDRNGAWPS